MGDATLSSRIPRSRSSAGSQPHKSVSIEACNPGHAHEWEVFKTVQWPQEKVILPGVIDTTTSHIEHPRVVAQRLMNYARLVGGPDKVMACTDCGFSTSAGAMNVPTEIVYAKLQSMVKGAKLASDMWEEEAEKEPAAKTAKSGEA